MIKKKAQKVFFKLFRFLARVLVPDLPIILLLVVLVISGRLNWISAVMIFAGCFAVSVCIMLFVFHELEKFIAYMRSLAQGFDVEAPRFHRGIFGSFRLADAFLAVKNLWSEQTLSDARILENLPDPLLMVNATFNVVFANKMALNFLGDSLLHQPVAQLFPDATFTRAFNQVASGQSRQEWFEWTCESTQPYAFQVHVEQLPAAAKNGGTIVIVMHDITQLKLFKQQQADFFTNASHELKTPLAIISGCIETLQGPAKDDPIACDKFLTLMSEQTDRMTHLVQDLLSLSRVKMTGGNKQSEIVLLSELLKNVVDGMTIKAQTHQQTIVLKLLHDIPRIKGNKSALHQVFQNLVDNAVKYGEKSSVITVTAQLCNGFPKNSDKYFSDIRQVVMISVHNTGNPIPAENINRLFERFYRVDNSRTKSIEGTGLGLGIAQQIVSDHDGIIDVQSSRDRGTVFRVCLPIDL